MKHLKLNTCPSTQSYLKHFLEKFDGNQQVLVSSLKQTQGKGRGSNTWSTLDHSVAMSFVLPALETPTLTPLFIGVQVIKFIKEKFNKNLYLKWPNDILNENRQKIGGIICQLNGDNVIVGLGLNQFIDINTKDVENAGGVFDKIELAHCPHELASDLYQFILTNNDNQNTTIKDWELNCLHLNELVQIDEEKGNFIGLGKYGEAQLRTPNGIKSIISGSLFFIS